MRRACVLLALGTACSFDPPGPANGTGGDSDEIYRSCAEARDASEPDGVYQIDPDGAGAFAAHCDMTSDGGGWTLAIKADGTRDTFRFESPLWETTDAYNPTAPFRDAIEAKLPTFSRSPFTEIRIVFASGTEQSARLALAAPSLFDLFTAGMQPMPMPLGRDAWLALVPGAQLDDRCPAEGVNVGNSYNTVRLGIVANDSDGSGDCTPEEGLPSWDTKLGIGGSFACADCDRCKNTPSSTLAGPSVGSNLAGCGTVTAFAYLYVR